MCLMCTFLYELEESVQEKLFLWHLIAMTCPEVPVKSYTSLVGFHSEIFVVPKFGRVIHTHPAHAGVLAKPCNAGNRWLRMSKKDI